MYHSTEVAEKAEQHFISVFQIGTMPDEMPVVEWKGKLEVPILDFLIDLKLLSSKSEARRMIQNNGVKINGEKVEDAGLRVLITEGLVVQVGKRKFVKIKM